ncbi:MAG: hypothetical protein ACD_54C00943G0002 [uncultured bacterium]|nr:MAG: hypothetical protein ACD_54C00943G0002 [uncultured bacterium]
MTPVNGSTDSMGRKFSTSRLAFQRYLLTSTVVLGLSRSPNRLQIVVVGLSSPLALANASACASVAARPAILASLGTPPRRPNIPLSPLAKPPPQPDRPNSRAVTIPIRDRRLRCIRSPDKAKQ